MDDLIYEIEANAGPTPITRLSDSEQQHPPTEEIEDITDHFNRVDRPEGINWVHADAVYSCPITGMVEVVIGAWTSPAVAVRGDLPEEDSFKSSVVVIHPTLGEIWVWFFESEIKSPPFSKEAQMAYAAYIDGKFGGGCPI